MKTAASITLKQTRKGANAAWTAYVGERIVGAIGVSRGGLFEAFGFTKLGGACRVGVFLTKTEARNALRDHATS